MSHVFAWIAQYGYGAIFVLLMLGVVGLPVPDETLLVYCGYLISKGVMNPPERSSRRGRKLVRHQPELRHRPNRRARRRSTASENICTSPGASR